ncbi:ATP-dependent RNA helicase DHX8-like [Ornithodoros turicata]|uniref:ATP-dependent RNA helicase DHX8-like n=1 Tax=Ornithodoros turicata TaxID=34597 RepID=UPI003139E09A
MAGSEITGDPFKALLRRMRTTSIRDVGEQFLDDGDVAHVPVYSRSEIQKQREALPIFPYKDQIIKTVQENQTVVLTGETGSGKSTQIAQYLHEAGIAKGGTIGCTEPRRVAAMSLARRVADEVDCQLGTKVGYCIRFEDCTAPETVIKYMTDGMLLSEAARDNLLEHYSIIVLDEAHERSIHTDVLFGVLKGIAKRRSDLKIIVTSATIDVTKFSNYFLNAPIIKIPGRLFPVEIFYNDDPKPDYYEASIRRVLTIHRTEPRGDILVFLSGQEEIDNACDEIEHKSRMLPAALEAMVLPLYSALPSNMQAKVFEPTPEGYRKVVVATNVAETSLTIDGVVYVVDSGVVKEKTYDPHTGVESLTVSLISQTQADQRSGRAGRTAPGKAYRMYSKAAYNKMKPTQDPEIIRNELASTILQLKALGVHEIMKFDFMDTPDRQALQRGIISLQILGALNKQEILTELGRQMTLYPVDPPLAKMLIKSLELGCSDEILTIIAMLSAQHIFHRPKKSHQQADLKKCQFNVPGSDHLTLLKVYNMWVDTNMSREWCYDNFVQHRRLQQARSVRNQLCSVLTRRNFEVTSCGKDTDKVLQALCCGFSQNIAVANRQFLPMEPEDISYKTVIGFRNVSIHPSSVLFHESAEWIVYHVLLKTTKPYVRCVSRVKASWVPKNIYDLQMRRFKVIDSAIATVFPSFPFKR